MRSLGIVVLALTACGEDVRTMPGGSSDSGADDGIRPDGGSTTIVDAATPPPDGIPPGLAPCEEAAYHSDFAWIQRTVFDVSCLQGCHSGQYPRGELDLSAGRSHAQLVNARSTYDTSWRRVVPGDPGASMLMVQLGAEPGPPVEITMPSGQPKLCDEQLDAIRRWIASGAQNN